MHLCLLALVTVMSATGSACQLTPDPARGTLESLRDRYRPLLVFAPSGDFPAYLEQVRILTQHAPGLTERVIVFVPIVTRPEGRPSSKSPTEPSLKRQSLTPDAETKARHQFQVGLDSFTVILIGKDGGEKLRAHTPLSFERLRDIVDAMPMRRQEMGAHQSPSAAQKDRQHMQRHQAFSRRISIRR